jgi:hypothetical protein
LLAYEKPPGMGDTKPGTGPAATTNTEERVPPEAQSAEQQGAQRGQQWGTTQQQRMFSGDEHDAQEWSIQQSGDGHGAQK